MKCRSEESRAGYIAKRTGPRSTGSGEIAVCAARLSGHTSDTTFLQERQNNCRGTYPTRSNGNYAVEYDYYQTFLSRLVRAWSAESRDGPPLRNQMSSLSPRLSDQPSNCKTIATHLITTHLIGISPAIVRAVARPRRRAHTRPGRHSAVIASHLATTSRSPLFPARPRPPLPVWRSTAAASAAARTDPPGVSCIRQKVTLRLVMSQGLPRRLSHRPAIEALHALPLGILPRRWAARVVLAQALLTEGARWTPTHSSRADAASRAGPVLMACRHTIRSASRPDMARSWRAVQPPGRRVRCPSTLVREPRENAPGRSHRTRALYHEKRCPHADDLKNTTAKRVVSVLRRTQ